MQIYALLLSVDWRDQSTYSVQGQKILWASCIGSPILFWCGYPVSWGIQIGPFLGDIHLGKWAF